MKQDKWYKRIESSVSPFFAGEEPKSWMYLLLVTFCVTVLIIPVFLVSRSSDREVNVLKTKLNELIVLSNDYRFMKEHIDRLDKRMSLTQVKGVARAVDEILSPLGMKGKLKSLKVIGSKDSQGALTKEVAEVKIEKVTMNELVNFFYSLENVPMMVSVHKVSMKKSFEAPELIDITMTLALFSHS